MGERPETEVDLGSAGWKDPEIRKQKIAERRKRALEKKLATREAQKADPDMPFRLRGIGLKARLVLRALFQTGSADPDILAHASGQPAQFVRRCLGRTQFTDLVRDIMDAMQPGRAFQLSETMFADASTSLREIDPAKAGALVKTREQVAAMLGVKVKEAPQAQQVQHQHAHLHMFNKTSDEALDRLIDKGEWDREKDGPPPWEG